MSGPIDRIALEYLNIRDLDDEGGGYYEVEAGALKEALDRAYSAGQKSVVPTVLLPEHNEDASTWLDAEQRVNAESVMRALGIPSDFVQTSEPHRNAHAAQQEWKTQRQKERSLHHDWHGEAPMGNNEKMALLARCFPVLWTENVIQFIGGHWSQATMLDCVKEDLEAEKRGGNHLCRASRNVLAFLLNLWDSDYPFPFRYAWSCWDGHQQAAFKMWMDDPWWP